MVVVPFGHDAQTLGGVDDVPGGRAGVDRLDNDAVDACLVGGRPGLSILEAHALGAHADGGRHARQSFGVCGVDEVRQAEKARDKSRLGVLVNLARCAHLLNATVVEHGDAVAQRQRLFLIVRDEDEGDANLALNLFELNLHLLAKLLVEGAERLIEQQHARLQDQRARQGDALPLTTRELVRKPICHVSEAHLLEGGGDALALLDLGHLAHSEPVRDVLSDRHVRKERVVLKDRVDGAVEGRRARDVGAGDRDRAACHVVEACDEAQHRGLAGARRSEHREELARLDVQSEIVDGGRRAEPFGHAGELDTAVAALGGGVRDGRRHMRGGHGGRFPPRHRCGRWHNSKRIVS